ncbi:MAG TPA: hypothetical protein VIZ22_11505, partial [Candidatus Limnocylindrales bacterium]
MIDQPTVRRPRTGASDLELFSLGWRRIQVLLRVRPPDAGFDPALVRIRHKATGAAVPLTGWEADEDCLTLRVNVMQGPDAEPLAPGRWELVVPGPRGGKGDPVRLVGDAVAAGQSAPMSFAVGLRGTLNVVASVAARSGTFAIEVELDPTVAEPDEDATPIPGAVAKPGLIAQAVMQVRIAAFAVMFWCLRILARRNGRRILFSSDSRADLGGNLKLVHDRMVARGLDREFELLTL